VKTHPYGYGHLNFYVVNMRGVNQFGMFRGGKLIRIGWLPVPVLCSVDVPL